MQHLVYRQPQNIAVHRRDAVQLPVLRVLLDDFVHLVPVFERAADERVGKLADGQFLRGRWRQFHRLAPVCDALIFGDRRCPLRLPKMLQRRRQVRRRVQVVLK